MHLAPAAGPGFARYFEGWELGGITLALVLSTALLAVPRASVPDVFPVPLVDVGEARATRLRLAQLADRAQREGLPFETRAVGDAVRRLGLVLSGRPGDVEHLRRVLNERVQLALAAKQQAPLARLRAVQVRLFLSAVAAHVPGSKPSDELAALGGDFTSRATSNGWLGPRGFTGSEDELCTLFVMRWSQLTRLRDEPELKPSLAELRRYYRFLLLYPERGQGLDAPSIERAELRLRYVAALARQDGEYPAALARGSLLAQLGRAPEAVQALSGHLAQTGVAEWKLRARNQLLYAADGRSEEP